MGCLKAKVTFKYKEGWCSLAVGIQYVPNGGVLAGLKEICLVACAFR